jgi:hypothetical protein
VKWRLSLALSGSAPFHLPFDDKEQAIMSGRLQQARYHFVVWLHTLSMCSGIVLDVGRLTSHLFISGRMCFFPATIEGAVTHLNTQRRV